MSGTSPHRLLRWVAPSAAAKPAQDPRNSCTIRVGRLIDSIDKKAALAVADLHERDATDIGADHGGEPFHIASVTVSAGTLGPWTS